MKKFFSYSLLTLSLASCAFMSPTPTKVTQNLQQVNPGTNVAVVALVPMEIPNPTQPKILNSTAFRVTQDVHGYPNTVILIPQNAIITGVYSNDGKVCQVSWQAVYHDYQALEKDQGALGVATMVNNTSCDPKLGIRPGQIMTMTFK
jgi:hypothetical protein